MNDSDRLKVAILMMQKNDSYVTPIFLRYHEALFGSSSLHVFDNGSTDPVVIAELKAAECRGVRVYWGFDGARCYQDKGEIFARHIHCLDEEDPHDFYFPMDNDEFLACVDSRGPMLSRSSISEALRSFKDNPATLRISHKYWANPLYRNRYQLTTSSAKCFFARGGCGSLDHGFHHGRSKNDLPAVDTPIVYFEFHYRTYDENRRYSREKLMPYHSGLSRKSLRHYAAKQSNNYHCANELLLSRYDYFSLFAYDVYPLVDSSFLDVTDALGIKTAHLFEVMPLVGFPFWMKWLKLRSTLTAHQAVALESLEDLGNALRRFLRRLVKA